MELRKAVTSETKSTAGDKHETGRAMLHLEMEKEAQKREAIQQMKFAVNRISLAKHGERIGLGSLVETNLGMYFISISAGQITIDEQTYYAVSIESPIGAELLGKIPGDVLVFNGRKLQIHGVS